MVQMVLQLCIVLLELYIVLHMLRFCHLSADIALTAGIHGAVDKGTAQRHAEHPH